MALSITGTIHKIFDRESVSEKFTKRNFVVNMPDGNYPQMINFQLSQDRCDLIDNWKVGDDVKVNFNLRGREWQEKFFTTIEAWKIEANGQAAQPSQPAAQQEPASVSQVAENQPVSEDLPF